MVINNLLLIRIRIYHELIETTVYVIASPAAIAIISRPQLGLYPLIINKYYSSGTILLKLYS